VTRTRKNKTKRRDCPGIVSGANRNDSDSVEMRLLRTCCVCQCRSGSSPRHHRKRRKRRKSGRHGGSSDRESVSGSETGGVGAVVAAAEQRTEAVDQQRPSGGSRRSGGGSKRRQRATYRYEVVYRREEFSHDYLDHPEIEEQVQNHHHLPVFRPVPEGQPTDSQPLQQQQQQPSAVVPFQSADYSLLSNYGRLEDFHPPALHSAVHSWEQQQQRQPPQQHHSCYNDQPLYQNFGGTSCCPSPFFIFPTRNPSKFSIPAPFLVSQEQLTPFLSTSCCPVKSRKRGGEMFVGRWQH